MAEKDNTKLNRYQILMIVCLVVLLFTIVVDYMLISALSAIIVPELHLDTSQFGILVGAYGVSAAISSLISITLIDRFDRKSYLLFFYIGFLVGILACGLSPDYNTLLASRIFTGLFGGVVGAICLTIITDLFDLKHRGRVMGFIQMSYAAGQIGGLPLALKIANDLSWNSAYFFIAGLGIIVAVLIVRQMEPLKKHLSESTSKRRFSESLSIVKNPKYWNVFGNNSLIVVGDIMLLTFDSLYMSTNLGFDIEQVPLVYLVTGGVTLVFGPIIGRLADHFGKYKVFLAGSLLTATCFLVYSNIESLSFGGIIAIHILIFIGINARMVSSTSLGMSLPKVHERGSFMAMDTSIQQLAAGISAAAVGSIVAIDLDQIEGYFYLGILMVILYGMTSFLMYRIHLQVNR